MMKYSWKSRVYILISCLFFIALWQVSAIIIDNDIYIPRIQQVIKSIVEIVNEPDFFKIVLSSFYRTAISYILALGCSMILGVLSVVYPFFKYLLSPLNSFVKTIPTMVLVVLALVWFTKDSAPFVVGFAITFPILYEGVRNSIMQIDKKLIDMTEIYEVELIDKIKKIYFPVMKFYFMSIFVSTFSLTFKVVIAGEIHGQPKFGIGTHIQLEKVNFNVSGIFAWIIIIMFISLIFELINRFLQKKIYRWNK
ncbi:ABC transporter permease [Clostridium saccharobutylicum]|uniref:ABC-type transporter, integral membrane subunit n=2 Tax=Clostridium saccharobutylicum TaxID=169679 RepID=U5MNW5_CLOSA|nr:ABC transporter permease subunit [Clostridium saccharobutylicum]AGX42285.1 ABC-type transporter, integral membrane subunit [Clostridium saccharobutylicum DSM 13864]AQR89566.1 putative aliphatic sulfonates transport permease protein SsuC [Clostridium saccharobutylicum]AQR99468.1 putative aliphatic sulfonates transport permease protein SsuC [Clostridium saccharobutylicum]AQS09200.1 putative aliphatic sulfonates transport permease protein SsuC [Clostridium saccharobutylicum]AQS13454.1 putative